MNYGENVTEQFQRERLAELLAQCTDEQRRIFNLMYPNGVGRERLPWALTQCNNSVQKNRESKNETSG